MIEQICKNWPIIVSCNSSKPFLAQRLCYATFPSAAAKSNLHEVDVVSKWTEKQRGKNKGRCME